MSKRKSALSSSSAWKKQKTTQECKDYRSSMVLKEHSENCPLWVTPNHHIFLETSSSLSKQAIDFLLAVAEPVQRLHFIHEYILTTYSLATAGSLGLSAQEVVNSMQRFSKNLLPDSVVQMIRDHVPVQVSNGYDYKGDKKCPDIPISLRPQTRIRGYQSKSLQKMFGSGHARSGIVVLPCGAGKTLVGITACSTMKKQTLVCCTTTMAAEQWREQFLRFTNIPESGIVLFTGNSKPKWNNPSQPAHIVVTTYSMLAKEGERSAESEEALHFISSTVWGLLLLDEVHVAPAQIFRNCMTRTHSRCKLGLTATLVREDDLIRDLAHLIGPKLYEANWMELQEAGYLANVQCIEISCALTDAFRKTYEGALHPVQRKLYSLHPEKVRICDFLIRKHEAAGDKILVCSDHIATLEYIAQALKRPYIYGGTGHEERRKIFDHFQTDPRVSTVFMSSIGDASIDLPNANVLIQLSSHYASRRQEAQRLGRVLRPKAKKNSATFYSLVTRDTPEQSYAENRQKFLTDQGYAFHVISSLPLHEEPDLCCSTVKEQNDLLRYVLQTKETTEEETKESF